MKAEIRTAVPKDIEDLFRIEKLTWKDDATPRRSLITRIKEFPEGFLVATIGGRVVGFVNSALLEFNHKVTDQFDDSFNPWNKIHKKEGTTHLIYSWSVHPEYSRNGVGRTLLANLTDRVRQNLNVDKIWILGRDIPDTTGPATTEYFKRFGFNPIKSLTYYYELPITLLESVKPYRLDFGVAQ